MEILAVFSTSAFDVSTISVDDKVSSMAIDLLLLLDFPSVDLHFSGSTVCSVVSIVSSSFGANGSTYSSDILDWVSGEHKLKYRE